MFGRFRANQEEELRLEKERLNKMSEKELLIEMILELKRIDQKCDDIARELPHHEEEFKLISNCLRSCDRDMVFSVSPGPSRLERSEFYKQYANMWRITDDFWDEWHFLYEMFERAEKWSIHSGAGHWPDADMLPFGAIRQCYDENEWTKFTNDELFTNMTLWSIMRSPLILGGEMTKFDKL